MNNVDINGLNDINVVRSLFESVNCIDVDNIFLVVLNRDYLTSSGAGDMLSGNATVVGAKTGGIVGGIVGGAIGQSINNTVKQAIQEFHSKLNDKLRIVFSNSVCGFLVNITTKGIGLIPLLNDNKLLVKVKDLKTDINNYVYFSNDEIDRIEIQKLPLYFSSKKLAIYFKGLEKNCTPWTLPKKHKLISYQKDNFNKLVNKINNTSK